MLQLLKTEWLKVKHYSTFWILTILYFVGIWGALYLSHQLYDNISHASPKSKGGNMTTAILGKFSDFPDVWHVVSFSSSWLVFIPALLIIISVTNEFNNRTHRQNVIDGWSRRQFVLAKVADAVTISLVATLAVFVTALVLGLVASTTPFSFNGVEYIGYFFIQALSYCSVGLLFSLLFKKPGITIALYFFYTVFLENICAGLLNHFADYTGRYLPLETTDNLIRFPFLRVVVNQFMPSYNMTALLIASAVYLALYYFISFKKFETDDL